MNGELGRVGIRRTFTDSAGFYRGFTKEDSPRSVYPQPCSMVLHHLYLGFGGVPPGLSGIVGIMFRNSLKMLLGGKGRKNNSGGGGIEPEGSEVRMTEGFTRSLPSSPLLNLRLAKRTEGVGGGRREEEEGGGRFDLQCSQTREVAFLTRYGGSAVERKTLPTFGNFT
ncbi:hypothetical protein INR49_006470 [Caranx melampygus]|nr:hypothetical protein INR49_006470 [Caranx melampygus]